MVKNIFLKELYEYLQDNRMVLSITIILILMILNGVIFITSYERNNQTHRKIVTQNQNKLRHNKNSKNYMLKAVKAKVSGRELEKQNTLFDLVFLKQKLLKKPSKLGIISKAKSGLIPDGISATYFSIENPKRLKSKDTFSNKYVSMDWANILIYFISFMCICFAYNAFSGEKFNGTLKLMLTNKVSRWQIIMGKLLGIITVILIPFLLGMLIDLLIISINDQIALNWNHLSIILYFIFGAIIFVSVNVLLVFFISLITSTPAQSLSISLITWVVLVIVIPNTSWLIAKQITPVKTIEELSRIEEKRKNEATKDCSWSWSNKWENKPPNEKVLKRAKCQNIETKIHNEIWNSYRKNIIAQTNTGITLTKISPFGVFRFFGENLSDKGFTGYEKFYYQFTNYHDVYKNFIEEKDAADKESYHLIWNELTHARTFMSNKKVAYNEIPQFQEQALTFKKALKKTQWDITILFCWCIVLFYLSFITFVKYDVR